MNNNKSDSHNKHTLQLILSAILVIFGITLLFTAMLIPPAGIIHSSVLVAYGEVSTFCGSILGIDYSYKYKQLVAKQHENEKKG